MNGTKVTAIELWADDTTRPPGTRPGAPVENGAFDVSNVAVHIGDQSRNTTFRTRNRDGILLDSDKYYWLVVTLPGGLGWVMINSTASNHSLPITITNALAGRGPMSDWQLEQGRSAVLGLQGCFIEEDDGDDEVVVFVLLGVVFGVCVLTALFVGLLGWMYRKRKTASYETVPSVMERHDDHFSL